MENRLKNYIGKAIEGIYSVVVDPGLIQIQETRKEFSGDFTVVVFPFTKYSKSSPEATGDRIGSYLVDNHPEIKEYNVIKGFLNIVLADSYWSNTFEEIISSESWGFTQPKDDSPVILVEYSSPNTNKPLHLGHIRNILLGFSLNRILSSTGNIVRKTNIVNDRGIHICKSMVAWSRFGNGETPDSSRLKGDHLVGKYYVLFDQKYKAEIEELIARGMSPDIAKDNAPILLEAREVLLKWEAGDKDVLDMWNMMNSWVYDGFDITYDRLGVDFDKIYYESETYLRGREIVLSSLESEILYKQDDEIGRASCRERV